MHVSKIQILPIYNGFVIETRAFWAAIFHVIIFTLESFFAASAAVLESIGTYKICIVRHGNMDEVIKVRYVYHDHSVNSHNFTKNLSSVVGSLL